MTLQPPQIMESNGFIPRAGPGNLEFKNEDYH
jgi:hypothetical protein